LSEPPPPSTWRTALAAMALNLVRGFAAKGRRILEFQPSFMHQRREIKGLVRLILSNK
jgi:hypothetical protein